MISQERSAAARNGLPEFRPYVYRGSDREPAAETRRAAEVMPDPAPGYEWYREMACDD